MSHLLIDQVPDEFGRRNADGLVIAFVGSPELQDIDAKSFIHCAML